MPAYRCGMCNLNYPPIPYRPKCDVCGGDCVWYRGIEQDPNYLEKVDALKNPPEVEFEGAHPKNAEVEVHVMEGDGFPPWLFIAHADLIEVGYKNLEDFDVVRVNGDFYELQGYVDGAGVWWVEEIPLGDAEEASEA